MKHLFLVHSPITYLISVSIINELKITKEDAVIIFFEFDKIEQQNQYISVSISEYYNKNNFFKKIFNFFYHFNIIKRIDRLVNVTIGNEKFISYVPVLLFTGKALITNANCCSFNFIEEGLADYYKEETFVGLTAPNSKDTWRSSFTKSIKRILYEMYVVARGYNLKLQALPFSYSCYTSFPKVLFYGFTNESFPLASNEKKRILSFEKKNLGPFTK